MALKAGIVGLPNVGKSTLFNAITKKNILAANYPFATIDPNVGVVTVPDKRVEYLENLYMPKSVVPTTYEFTDIAGLVKGASMGEGLGNQFLSHIREVDAIVEVVRCFDDGNIIHVEGGVNPVRDVEIINVELMLADSELLSKLKDNLEKNIPLRKVEFNEDELLAIKNFHFLTLKPIIYMANVSEEDVIFGTNKYVEELKKYALDDSAEVIVVSAKMESELSELNDDDKQEFLNDLGISESGLDKLITATYSLLGLSTFFTAGSDEVRAWTFKNGMKAPQCAGIIHSDFERGFIKAEIMSFSDLKQYGSEKEVKEAGRMRLEGKEYLMQDGDICYFRFNV